MVEVHLLFKPSRSDPPGIGRARMSAGIMTLHHKVIRGAKALMP